MGWLRKIQEVVHGKSPLSDSALLAGLSPGELRILDGFVHQRSFLPGEIIFDKGEEGQALYFILSGQVLICHPGDTRHPIATLDAGNFFGELGLIDNWPRSAQAVSGQDTRLAVLFRGDFERLMDSHARIASRIAMHLARYLGKRLRDMLVRMENQSQPA